MKFVGLSVEGLRCPRSGVITSSLAHLEENMAAEKLQLSPDEWKKIEELARSCQHTSE
jgi:aryl-alcohol dehydrogenase-like predicted oxidoreductase